MSGEKHVICIIDGKYDFRDSISLMLRSFGWTVYTYASLHIFKQDFNIKQPPNAFIVDLDSNEEICIELQDLLNNLYKNTPIIAFTSNKESEHAKQADMKGAMVIQKPLKAQALVKILNSL